MLIGITVICCSLLYSILVTIVYFSKKKVKNAENKIYSFLLKINIVGLLLELLCCFFLYYSDVSNLFTFFNIFVNKLFLIYLLTWEITFTSYIFFISFYRKESFKEKIQNNLHKVFAFIGIIYSIILIFVLMLPLYYFNDGTYIYSYGPATNLLLGLGCLFIVFDFFCLFKNLKNIRNKKYYPLFILVLLMIFVTVLRQVNPGLIVINSCFAFVTVLMYFTIENPDVQIVDLFIRNKELSEQAVNDKTNFLFKISQELKSPLLSMKKEVSSYKEISSADLKDESVNHIEGDINKALFMINDVIDVSSMDVKKFKVLENKYNTSRFFLDIETNVKNQISIAKKNELINFKFNIEGSCPKFLYGDNIKLKQILLSLVGNSIKYTDNGFIDIDIDVITRYDACRLLFTISDSGCGMDIDMVNELLSTNEVMSIEEFQKADDLNLNIPTIMKLLKVLGGSISINSKEGKGTVISVVVTERVDYDTTELFLRDVKKYNIGLNKKHRILLLEDDTEYIDKISRILKKHDCDVISTLLGKDVIDKIKNGDSFDIILLKDDIKPDSAYTILRELKKDSKFKTPVIVMIGKDKEFIKDHFISDGFSDCLVYERIDSDIEKIFDKYI